MSFQTAPLTLAAVIAAGFASSASAATLVDFRFDTGVNIDENAPYSGGSTTSALNVLISQGLVSGSGVTSVNNRNQYEVAGLFDGPALPAGSLPTDLGTLQEALLQSEFTGFSAAAASGFELDLAGGNVTFNNFERTGNATRAPTRASLFSSVDGFTLVTQALSTSTAFSTFGSQDLIFDIPDAERFDDLSDVEFRVYFYRDTPPTTQDGGYRSRPIAENPSVVLNGEVSVVVVPEPASLALMGLGGLLVLGRTRRA